MPLTDTVIRNTKPGANDSKMSDGGGLFLLVKTTGAKWWRFSYRYAGKQKTLSFGVYPDIGLKDARERRDEAKKLLAQGVDPGAVRKAQKSGTLERAANSFEVVAREWFEKWKGDKAISHTSKVIRRLEKDVFPWLGGVPVAELADDTPKVLEVLRRIESRGMCETAKRAKENISQVMRYAIATGRARRDPCPDLKDALQKTRRGHFASITDPIKAGELLRAMDAFTGTYTVRAALLLAPLVFVRPGELRAAKWAEINLDKGEWCYFVSKTKTDHLVPLSRQAAEILRDLQPLTGQHEHVFPGRDPKKPISNMTLNAAIKRMGYDTKEEITGHGFRAMARTLLAEKLNYPPEVIEHQLAHKVPDALGTAYNRTKYLDQRRAMMQEWADYLDRLKAGADVVQLHGKAA
ncbi:MAG: integrase arm-type DNA-binding domain-containing protein [Zoogloeaceae bacterium]|jgi:integrase|nr:integrase arm-type DNA-binding domain-containing protein [Zoogloeaceae bacterium]